MSYREHIAIYVYDTRYTLYMYRSMSTLNSRVYSRIMSLLAELRRVNCPSEHKFRAFVRQSGEEWEINVSSVRFEMGRLEGRKATFTEAKRSRDGHHRVADCLNKAV